MVECLPSKNKAWAQFSALGHEREKVGWYAVPLSLRECSRKRDAEYNRGGEGT